MNRHTTLLALLVVGGLACSRAAGAVRIVPVDGLTMINPVDGHSVKGIGRDGGVSWQEHNAVWDGRVIRLAAARGEVAMFQLVFLREPQEHIEQISIRVDLPGLEKAEVWRSWCIWKTPEVAVPLSGGKYSFDLPSRVPGERNLFAKDGYTAWSAGVELFVGRDAKAGTLRGSVTVSAKSGLKTVRLPLELKVLPFALPARPSLIVEMNSYGDYHKFLARSAENYLALHRLMREHRCTFVEIPYGQGGYISSPYLSPAIRRRRPGLDPTIDWTRFDATVGGLFDGSAFPDKQPVSHFVLPLCYNVPISFKWYREDPDYYKRANTIIRKLWAEHIKAKGWTRTVFQEFHNENPDAGAKCPWHLDEPRTAEDLEGHRLYLDILQPALKVGGDRLRLHYRIDISDWRRLGEPLKRLAPRVQDWCVSRDRRFLNADSAAMFRKWADANGGLLLEYGEVLGFNVRGKRVNWSQFERYQRDCLALGLDGWEQWMIDMWKIKGRHAPSTPLFYSNAAGARDLVWPGEHLGFAGVLPSIRLKAIRESLNLFDYAAVALRRRAVSKAELDRMLGEMDVSTSADHFKLKSKLAALIAAAAR